MKRRPSLIAAISYLLAILGVSLGAMGNAGAAGSGRNLLGAWQASSAERDGAPAPDLVGHSLVISNGRFRISKGSLPLFGGAFDLPSRKHPQWINFRQTEGPALQGEWLGLYRLRGNELEIIDNAADMRKSRPTRFRTAPNSGYILVRFKRR